MNIDLRNTIQIIIFLMLVPYLGGCVIDANHRAAYGKVTVCHKNKHTITVSKQSLQAHIKHGDYEGRCVS